MLSENDIDRIKEINKSIEVKLDLMIENQKNIHTECQKNLCKELEEDKKNIEKNSDSIIKIKIILAGSGVIGSIGAGTVAVMKIFGLNLF